MTFLLQLPRLTQLAAGMLMLHAAVMIWDQYGWWTTDEEYHFGFLLPLFALFVLSERWGAIREILERGGSAQLAHPTIHAIRMPSFLDRGRITGATITVFMSALALGGMILFLLGGIVRLAEGGLSVPSTLLLALGFASVFLGIPYLFVDRDLQGNPIPASLRLTLVKLLLFPAVIWLIAAPLPGFLKQELKLFLLHKVVTVVYAAFELFGYPLIQEGNTFLLPEGRVGVADACSGIRSLTGCMVTGAFLAAVSFKTWLPKVVMMVAALALAVFGNLARSLYLTIHAYIHGGDSISGFIHDATGYAVLGFTALGLLGVIWLISLGNRDWSRVFVEPGRSGEHGRTPTGDPHAD
jgi:exosortase/archaeosortase family protein